MHDFLGYRTLSGPIRADRGIQGSSSSSLLESDLRRTCGGAAILTSHAGRSSTQFGRRFAIYGCRCGERSVREAIRLEPGSGRPQATGPAHLASYITARRTHACTASDARRVRTALSDQLDPLIYQQRCATTRLPLWSVTTAPACARPGSPVTTRRVPSSLPSSDVHVIRYDNDDHVSVFITPA